MLFNSYIFILFFLPVTLLMYYGLNHIGREKAAKVMLIAMSLWFYAYFHVSYLFILAGSVLVNYGISRGLAGAKLSDKGRKGLLAAGILGNTGVIFYFKYFNFFLENVNWLFHTSFPLHNILLPLGISFFTFQQISYLVDSYRGETASYGFLEYALFVTFFPQLIAGPIVAHHEIIPQLQDKERTKWNPDMMARGIYLFAMGLGKKVLLADMLGVGADWGFARPELLSAADTILVSLLYTLQIYFDFSGYCDMACGIANMFHLELPVNFLSPYKSLSIDDFWKRWHISLTRFLRKYIYFPMGGSRKGTLRTVWNVMVVFLVSGIWHGANWTFVLWGCAHGAASVLYKIFGRLWDKLPAVLRWALNFIFIDLTWILFRADSLEQCGTMFANLLTAKPGGIHPELAECFDVIEFTYLKEHLGIWEQLTGMLPGLHMWIVLAVALGIALFARSCQEKKFCPNLKNGLGSMAVLVWSVMSLSGLSTFLYFNF